jgi:hypothetical protein
VKEEIIMAEKKKSKGKGVSETFQSEYGLLGKILSPRRTLAKMAVEKAKAAKAAKAKAAKAKVATKKKKTPKKK